MAIPFACPSCGRGYRVKDELAGKTAKCGKCGKRMKVPRSVSTESAAVELAAAEPTPADSAPMSSDEGTVASWMDENLAAPPPPAAPADKMATCPSCGASQPRGTPLCGSCGADIRGVLPQSATRPMAASSRSPRPRQKHSRRISFGFLLGARGSLIRGTLLSMVFALAGAALWAVVAFFSRSEFGIIALGLGGMAGFGMALGREDDGGTVGGIIAAFMSLFGIIAAKGLVVVAFVFAAVAQGEFDEDPFFEHDVTQISVQRELSAALIASRSLGVQGLTVDAATDEQIDQELATARARMAKLSDEEVTEIFLLLAELKPEDLTADRGTNRDTTFVDALRREFLPLLDTMFGPIDGLFILLAFFTAYKVGSGTNDD